MHAPPPLPPLAQAFMAPGEWPRALEELNKELANGPHGRITDEYTLDRYDGVIHLVTAGASQRCSPSNLEAGGHAAVTPRSRRGHAAGPEPQLAAPLCD